MRSLRVLELNAWIGLLVRGALGVERLDPPGHKEKRFRALVSELRALDPDVVTLQECLPLPRFAERLAAEAGYDVIWRVCNSGLRVLDFGLPWGIGRGEGVAILARAGLGLTQVDTRRLSGHGFVTHWVSLQLGPIRYALAGRIDLDGRPVVIVTTHVRYGFPNRGAFDAAWETLARRGHVDDPTPPVWIARMAARNRATRDLELDRLAAWLEELRGRHGAPVVLGADLNLEPDAPEVARLCAVTGFTNALPLVAPSARTWDPDGNPNVKLGTAYAWADGSPKPVVLKLMAYLDRVPQCPDHILVSPDLAVRDAGLACHHPVDGVFASDHYGVWADLTLT